jgi:hypothetical protein
MRILLGALSLAVLLAAPSAALAGDVGIADIFNTGCRVTASPVQGCFMAANVRGPGFPGELARGSRVGQACGWNLLALFTWGDVRISTAMRNGGLSKISSVDSKSFELLPGFYGVSRYCTVVSGE